MADLAAGDRSLRDPAAQDALVASLSGHFGGRADAVAQALLEAWAAIDAAGTVGHIDAGPAAEPLTHMAVQTLTPRQRDCVLWSARGKSDWEIGVILGIQTDTVAQHLKGARQRYGVQKRTLLAIHALHDGTLTFDDVLGERPPTIKS